MKDFWAAAALLLSLSAPLPAEEAAEPATREPLIMNVGARFIGADLSLGWRGLPQAPAPDTLIWLIAGGGYETAAYFRTPADELYSGGGGFNPRTDPYYTRLNARLDLGIAQGLAFNERRGCNLLEAFLFYKTRLDETIDDPAKNELILASNRRDASGLFQNSLLAGISYADIDTTDPHRTLRGVYAEATAEWGPAFLLNMIYGYADFLRFNLSAKGFLPLFDIDPRSKLNLLSGYGAAFFACDWSTGDYIPINIRQTFGGRTPRLGVGDAPRQGLGLAVRGYESARFDSPLKAVLNLEIRFNLPQFTILETITPGVMVFFDSGYYNFLSHEASGFLCSTGVGVFLNLWKLTSFSLYTAFDLTETRADGISWVPMVFSFNLHF